MIGLLRLCRLYYTLPMSGILTLTLWYAMGDMTGKSWWSTLWATAALALVISGGYVLNDVNDRSVDRVNDPSRPIPAGQVSVTVATWWACILFAGGLAVATLCRWQFLVILGCVVALLVFYDTTSKRLGITKQLIVALLLTSVYPLAFAQAGASAASDRVPTLYIFPIWLFLTAFGYEILKDIRDIKGDCTINSEPTWIQHHPDRARKTASIVVILGSLVLIVPGFVGCGYVYLAIIPAAIALAVGSAFLAPRRAIMAVYAECVVVGIAATADIIIANA